MVEKRFKGIMRSIVPGILFLGIAILSTVAFMATTGVDNLYRKGEIVQSSNLSNGNKALVVTAIIPEPLTTIEGYNSNLYLVEYDNTDGTFGYIGLDANDKDPIVERLIAKGDKLVEKPERIEVELITSSDSENGIEGYESFIQETFNGTDLEGRVSRTYYASLREVSSTRWMSYALIAVTGLIGIACLVGGVLTVRQNKRNYEALYLAYPDLHGNLDNIIREATYHDERLGLLVYKTHLISYKVKFYAIDLTQVTSLYHHIISTKAYGLITTSRHSQLMVTLVNQKKVQKVFFKNIGKSTDDELQPLFALIEQTYPNISLGYDQK
ncbi:hypothetical protein [Streptococcus sp. S784/96/1]|uniref:hypothetical protein n=1 Tax=Streptococcus sp. S784/96/1 TaxID=2653499 RepID=UPI0013894D6C|nr:hypothetical protein [Streptococcus sp. S784/96/1]